MRRKPDFLTIKFSSPDDDALEDLRIDRLKRAFSDKCPKLELYKEEGARTGLVLKSRDVAFTRFDLIGHHLPVLLAERT